MVRVIVGNKGTGKTKMLIDAVNKAMEESKGHIVCLDKGTKLRYDINYRVRLIDLEEYGVTGFEQLRGVIVGIMADDYDNTDIFMDSILKICGRDLEALGEFLADIDKLTTAHGVTFTCTVSADISEVTENVRAMVTNMQ